MNSACHGNSSKGIMNRLYPHHKELPEGVLNDFLTTEEFLLAQLKWAFEKYAAVIHHREDSERYEEINQQCQGRDYGFSKMQKAFEDIGLDFKTEQGKHLDYTIPHNTYQMADKAYKDFLVKEGRTYPLQTDPTLIVKKDWGQCGTVVNLITGKEYDRITGEEVLKHKP